MWVNEAIRAVVGIKPRPHRRMLSTIGAILVVGLVAFGVTYLMRGSSPVTVAQGEVAPPGPEALPTPGVTPDTTVPFWHIPYVNEDRQLPHFKGVLNSISIDADFRGGTGFDACPVVGLAPPAPKTELQTVMAPGALRIDMRALGPGVSPISPPELFLCKGDLAFASWTFLVEPGTANVNLGGTNLTITRIKGQSTVNYGAPEKRWSAGQIAGLPAVVSGPVVVVGNKQFGPCFAAVYDKATDVMTTATAGAAMAQFCTEILKKVIS